MCTFTAAAIAESATITLYHHKLILCHEDNGTAMLWIHAQLAFQYHMLLRDAGNTSMLVQITLKNIVRSASQSKKAGEGVVLTKGWLPPMDSIMWADEIYPLVPKGGIAQHLVSIKVLCL